MTQAQQPEALRLAAICESKGMFSVADELNRMHARLLELEQGKCLHQIAEPAAPQAAQAAVPQVDWEAAATEIAIKVAKNCGSVPNLTHPYIYLGLKNLFTPAHPAEGVPAPEALEAVTKAILFEDCGSTEGWEENTNLGLAAIRALTQPQQAMAALKAAMADPEYAWSWHCAIWAGAHDEGLETGAANRAAARVMRMAFDCDTTKHANFAPEHLVTHPTQQGLDAQALKQSFREYLSVSEHIDAGGHAMDSIATDLTRIVLAEEEVSAVIARRVHCNTSGQSGEDAENIRAAAQAKQGGAA